MPLLRPTSVLMLVVLAGYTGPFAFSGCSAARCPFPVFQWVKIERDRSVVDVTELSAADEDRILGRRTGTALWAALDDGPELRYAVHSDLPTETDEG